MSPTQQVNKSQGGTAQLPVEPDTEIVQGGLGGQPSLKALQLVRALPVQPEGVVEFVKDRFHDLAYPGQPAPQSLGPRGLAVSFGRRDQPGAVAVLPPLMPLPAPQSPCRPHTSPALRQAQEASPGWAAWGGEYAGRRLKSSARVWSLALAGAKLKPVMTP